MRILVVHPGPEYSVSDVYEGYAEGFAALGHTVRGFNLNERLAFYSNVTLDDKQLELDDAATIVNKHLLAKCYEFAPDVIVIVSGFFITNFTWELWRNRHSKIVCLFTESPYEEDKQLQTARNADPALVILNDPVHLGRYRADGLTAHYIPHSYRPEIHKPLNDNAQYDFSFVGTGYPSRIQFFEGVDWGGLRVALAGNWPTLTNASLLHKFLITQTDAGLPNEETARLYGTSIASANLYRGSRGFVTEANGSHLVNGWAIGPREVELAATKTFFLREPRGEGDLLFPQMPTFNSPDEFSDQLRWWLQHDKERQEVVDQAFMTIRDRTFTNAARRLLELLP